MSNVGPKCSFCGKSERDSVVLVAGPVAYICEECIETSSLIVEERRSKKTRGPPPKPPEIVAWLDEAVVGHTAAKRALAVTLRQHLLRPRVEHLEGPDLPAPNVMLVGPTGCGKTGLLRRLRVHPALRVEVVNATGISPPGYVGPTSEDLLLKLIAKEGDPRLAERGVLALDNVDLLVNGRETTADARRSSKDNVQYELVRLVDQDRRHPPEAAEGLVVDTARTLFIAAGAFEGIEHIVAERLGTTAPDPSALRAQVVAEDLIRYGLAAEVVRRFPRLVVLSHPDPSDLRAVLDGGTAIGAHAAAFAKAGVELIVEEAARAAMVEEAHQLHLGIPGLQGILHRVLEPARFDLDDTKQGMRCVVAVEAVHGGGQPAFVKMA